MKKLFTTFVENLTDKENKLSKLVNRAVRIEHIDNKIQKLLDNKLADNCTVINYRHGILVIAAASSAWAAKLRMHCPKLLNTLRDEHKWKRLAAIKIQVSKNFSNLKATKGEDLTERKISSSSAKQIISTADSIIDPQLSQALARLAKHGQENSSEK